MRAVTALVLLLGVFIAPAAQAAAPDLSPFSCAWEKLPAAEQTRLRDGFRVDLKDKSFIIFFGDADTASATQAAQQCQQTLSGSQAEHFALGLARHAGALKAGQGVVDHGGTLDAVQNALSKMHEGKREVIGDKLACPGPHPMVVEWDESLKSAVRRANLRFENVRAYSYVSLALYALMAEEGAMRRVAGTAEPCS